MRELPINIDHKLDLESCKGCDEFELFAKSKEIIDYDGSRHSDVVIIYCEHHSACQRIERLHR